MGYEYSLSKAGTEAAEFELAKKSYASGVIVFFETTIRAYAMIPVEDMKGGVSRDIIKTYLMTAGEHVPHSELPKQELTKTTINLRYEDRETTTAVALSKRDELMNHYDANGSMSSQSGKALAKLFDIHSMSAFIEAARTSADGVFPGGNRVLRTLDTDIATTYPMTVAGSQRLQQDIADANLLIYEDDVPEDLERYCWLKKREHNVLMQDRNLMSRDYVGPEFSDLIHSKLLMVDGTWIIPTNNYPQSDLSGNTFPNKAGSTVLNGDYSASVAVISTSESCRKAELESIVPIFYIDDDRRHTVFGAAALKGIDTYRPEATCEIYVA